MCSYLNAVNHIVSLGFSRDHAESIAGMELDGLDAREAHYAYIIECDARDITDWIGIHPEAREVQPSLLTPAGRIEVRDLCTADWNEAVENPSSEYLTRGWESPRTTVTRAEEWIVATLADRGFKVRTENRATEVDFTSPSNPLTIHVTDREGWTLTLDFDPATDGFEYPTSGDDALALCEGRGHEDAGDLCESAVADGCLVPPSDPTR